MFTATYSPEDNKLRLYASARLDAELYARVKSAGFKWAPKQDLFFAPAWSPSREDLLIELAGEIDDEDKSLVDRADERAERFEDYSEKRTADANRAHEQVEAIAGNIPLGQPILVGHHSEKRARRDAKKIEDGMRRAVRMWDTASYWTRRAAGALQHAKYKELPAVRARRIKGIEADKRKQERYKAISLLGLKLWTKPGLTIEQARMIAGRTDAGGMTVTRINGTPWSAYDVLKPDGERYAACPVMTLDQVIEVAKRVYPRSIAGYDRWIAHFENRLAYERAMLAEAGGTVADQTTPEKGGACMCWASHRGAWSYIVKVNKVSVTLYDNWGNGGANFTRTIPFDKLRAILPAAKVEAARLDGRLVETSDATGFYLAGTVPDAAPKAIAAPPEPDKAEAMRESLRAGVQVVSAPQLFPTPPALAAQVVELADIRAGHQVLEPSAGTGNLIRAMWDKGASLYAVEINYQLAEALRLMVEARELVDMRCSDFLTLNGELGQFDRIVMNPPFEKGQDIAHIKHALGKLKPGGRLVAICANGPRQREALQPLATEWIDLPAGSFADSGTNVNAGILVIDRAEIDSSEPVLLSKQLGMFGAQAGVEIGPLTGNQSSLF